MYECAKYIRPPVNFTVIKCIFCRYMAMHGQVWDPKKDGDGLGTYSTTTFFMLYIILPATASESCFEPELIVRFSSIRYCSHLCVIPPFFSSVSSYTGGAGKTGIEKMMESMESGDSGGLPMVRPGDASKCHHLLFCRVLHGNARFLCECCGVEHTTDFDISNFHYVCGFDMHYSCL